MPIFGTLYEISSLFMEIYTMDTLGKRIKARREQLHMTQNDLANAIGLDSASKRTAISRLELNDRRVYSDILPTYAAALQTNVYYLLGMTDIADATDADILRILEQ